MSAPVAVLIGPPGAGKSTVGGLLADLLGVEFLDTDSLIEREAGKPVGDIFISDGEPAFRDMERVAVTRALASHPGVLALGGGAVMDPGTQRLLSGHRVVYLRTGFAAAAHRTGLDTPRPLLALNPRAKLRELLEQRAAVYESLAVMTVTTDDRDPQEIADELAATIAAAIAAQEGEGAGEGEEPAQETASVPGAGEAGSAPGAGEAGSAPGPGEAGSAPGPGEAGSAPGPGEAGSAPGPGRPAR